MKRKAWEYQEKKIGGELVRFYVPKPLPPVPPLHLDSITTLHEECSQALGRLDGLASRIPNLSLFIYAYVRKEAVLSSQIEGTQSSLSDLLLFENDAVPGVPLDDVEEVSNYVAALLHGIKRLRSGFPLSLRLIKEIHGILLSEGRGKDKQPGEFRRSQNWIGGTRPGNATFVPPPPELIGDLMGQLERFIHEDRREISPLVRASLVHAQFETIHPFLDGNGRLGRLIITFMLCACGVLREPILYLSLYLKTNRTAYYNMLTHVRETGDWESWIEFFLFGVYETANSAVDAARRILEIVEEDQRRIEALGRAAPSAIRLHKYAETSPLISIPRAATALGMTYPTVSKAVDELVQLKILKEITGKQRGRLFVYKRYLSVLNEGGF